MTTSRVKKLRLMLQYFYCIQKNYIHVAAIDKDMERSEKQKLLALLVVYCPVYGMT